MERVSINDLNNDLKNHWSNLNSFVSNLFILFMKFRFKIFYFLRKVNINSVIIN